MKQKPSHSGMIVDHNTMLNQYHKDKRYVMAVVSFFFIVKIKNNRLHLSLRTIHILGQIIVAEACLMHCRMLSDISGLYPPDTRINIQKCF